MSRNGAGVYSLPAGSTVTNGDTSDATDLNTPLADLEADANIPRPIVAGGTGASSAAAALINLGLTATAAEINVLDGVTATTAELNYVDGVTSPIQTQLNAKQAEVLTTNGDIVVRSGGTTTRLGLGANGQVPRSNGSALAYDGLGYTWASPITTNGASLYDVASIPSWATDILCLFSGVSLTTKTDSSFILIGPGGVPASTGYGNNTASVVNAAASVVSFLTTGFFLGTSEDNITGALQISRRAGSNEWIATGMVRRSISGQPAMNSVAGVIGLGGTLDIVRLVRSGVSNYNGGTFSVGWR